MNRNLIHIIDTYVQKVIPYYKFAMELTQYTDQKGLSVSYLLHCTGWNDQPVTSTKSAMYPQNVLAVGLMMVRFPFVNLVIKDQYVSSVSPSQSKHSLVQNKHLKSYSRETSHWGHIKVF